MRAVKVAALLGMAMPALGQDRVATLVLKGLFAARGDIEMAALCGLRDGDWYVREGLLNALAVRNTLRADPKAFGGTANATSFGEGANVAAAARATDEWKRRGAEACSDLEQSGRLTAMDQLLK